MECKVAAARIAAARERQWLLARLNKRSVKGATIDVTPIARVT